MIVIGKSDKGYIVDIDRYELRDLLNNNNDIRIGTEIKLDRLSKAVANMNTIANSLNNARDYMQGAVTLIDTASDIYNKVIEQPKESEV